MQKDLKDMSLEELWTLFPIILVKHNSDWKYWALQEIETLNGFLNTYKAVINHIGSTAIEGIFAKPIIDILVEIPYEINMNEIRILMESKGYICMSYTNDKASFNKGYTPTGYAEKVFHIHFQRYGDHDQILFRDYLTSHPEAAKQYEALKLSLLPQFRNDRDAYTDAKLEFVKEIMIKARQSF